jgi:DNA-binding transcriptional ArsR family regulator
LRVERRKSSPFPFSSVVDGQPPREAAARRTAVPSAQEDLPPASCGGGEAFYCGLTEPVALSQPTVSHHMKVLVYAGLGEVLAGVGQLESALKHLQPRQVALFLRPGRSLP